MAIWRNLVTNLILKIMSINPKQFRKTANWLIVVNATFIVAYSLIIYNFSFVNLETNTIHPLYGILVDMASISFIMLIGGIYLKGCYRYIWTQVEYNRYRIIVSIAIPLFWFIYLVISEYMSPTIIRSALDRSILMIYAVVIIRWIYKHIARHLSL